MSLKDLKETAEYVRYSEKLLKEATVSRDTSVERFDSLIENFREETKDFITCSWVHANDLCRALFEGEFEHHGTSGTQPFHNKSVMLAGFKVIFYLIPPSDRNEKYIAMYDTDSFINQKKVSNRPSWM